MMSCTLVRSRSFGIDTSCAKLRKRCQKSNAWSIDAPRVMSRITKDRQCESAVELKVQIKAILTCGQGHKCCAYDRFNLIPEILITGANEYPSADRHLQAHETPTVNLSVLMAKNGPDLPTASTLMGKSS